MIERLMTQPYITKGWYFRLTLLIGQSLSMGVTLALLIITANSLFLVDFGPQALPYVYIVVAFAGSLLSYGVTVLQRRWSLVKMAITTVAALSLFFFLSWLAVTVLQLRWISFALIVSFSLVIQIGFVFLGGQAGRLLDLRQIKRLFPQIVAGFVVGFLLGALAVPILVEYLGRAENVLIGLVAASLIWLAFLIVTSRRYPAELNEVSQAKLSTPEQSFFVLLRKPYVLLLFVYQFLAAVVNQLSDFFLLAQSAQRYNTSDGLAQFFSQFTVALNVTDLAVTTLIAGIFLSRFGLGAGLMSNPLVMGVLFLGMIATAPLLGIDSSFFFLLVVVARITSISLTDGTTRASVNTTYQALPAQERVQVQTGVEGIGVPVALGLVGVILLVFNALPGLSLLHLVLLAAVVAGVWLVIGLKVYQGYKISLVKLVSRRVLGEAEFSLEDHSTLEAIQHLLQSNILHHVRQALDVLESSEHDSVDEHLIELLTNPEPKIRVEALGRIERRQTISALLAVEQTLNAEKDPNVKGAALRALGALKEDGALETLTPYLKAEEPLLRQAAMVSMLRHGGIAGTLAAGQQLLALQGALDPSERILAAQVIGDVGARHFYQPLLPLLQDPDDSVRTAALSAATHVPHRRLLEAVFTNLDSPATRSAAAATLVAFGSDSLPILENALAGRVELSQEVVVHLLRISGQVQGAKVIACLKEHLSHPDDVIRRQILLCLNQCAYQTDSEDLPALNQAIRLEIEQGLRVLMAIRVLGNEENSQMLQRALADVLSQIHQRVMLLLSFQHNAQTILGAGQRLSTGDDSERALALEILDVSLSAELKSLVFSLIDPNLQLSQRIERLGRSFSLPSLEKDDQLKEIIANLSNVWQSRWLRACAIYTAGLMNSTACLPVIEKIGETDPSILQETAAWAMERLALIPEEAYPAVS